MSRTSCVLFFPGSRPELLAKAVASGAGLVCVDLEDAVAPEDKEDAREAVLEILTSSDAPSHLAVRINPPSSQAGEGDVAALAELENLPRRVTIMVPKAAVPSELAELHRRFGGRLERVSMIAVIETAVGLARVEDVAGVEGVSGLLLGGLDLSLDLGSALDWEALLYARSRCVHAARVGGVRVIDTPFFDVADPDGLRGEAERSSRLGFDAKAAIHPAQVSVIHEAFDPDPASVAHAKRVLAATGDLPGGAMLVDGVMVDRPAVEAARRIVSRADIGED
ncbi:MAG: CoA ester lyase [Gemmatimonadetes bacterium]|nr:CoA ester lyase [Gemmatimonadota bacterium]